MDSQAGTRVIRRGLQRLRREPLLAALLGLLASLVGWRPETASRLPALVGWHTLAALAGLLVLSRGLECSGYPLVLGRGMVRRVHGQRRVAALLVLLSAALAAVVTNDVALFIVVPLTLGIRGVGDLPAGRLVIFEALAVNAGSALSPVGNPQNLFLWQTSGASFGEFALWMLPFGAVMLALVLAAILPAFPARDLAAAGSDDAPVDRRLLAASLALYPLFVAATDSGHAIAAAGFVLALYLLAFPAILRSLDWALLLIIGLMFADLRLLAAVPAVSTAMRTTLRRPGGVFGTAMAASQLLSNVPAAILLQRFTPDWRTLAWGVNAGGYGLAVGSLANLIALRLAGGRRQWREFHRWSLPMLAAAGVAGYALLAVLH